MKHNFSDQELTLAWVEPALDAGESYPTADVDYIRAFLDALPEPASDDWQECRFEDIRKGDRVKNVLVRESGQIHTKEGVANKYQADESGEGLSWWFMGDYDQYIARSDEPHDGPIQVTLYRIPAPVQHPDPAEHPVIIICRPNGNGETPVSYAWTGQHYRSFDGQEYFSANEITDWSPAKVVADDDR